MTLCRASGRAEKFVEKMKEIQEETKAVLSKA